jgi:hypothetical protein
LAGVEREDSAAGALVSVGEGMASAVPLRLVVGESEFVEAVSDVVGAAAKVDGVDDVGVAAYGPKPPNQLTLRPVPVGKDMMLARVAASSKSTGRSSGSVGHQHGSGVIT